MKTILFSGTHGVGKGFFLDKVKDYITSYNVYSASKLIEKYQPSTDAGYKRVNNVKKNQDVLIEAINVARSAEEKNIILDGHLCILNSKGEIERIPEYFFQETKIVAVVLLQDDVQIIYERLKVRDDKTITTFDIRNMQKEEKDYACELNNKLNIRYQIISHDCTGEEFELLLKTLGGCSDE